MHTEVLEVRKYCTFSGELLCLNESGLICVIITDLSHLDIMKMIGKTYEFTGEISEDGNRLLAKQHKEVHHGR